MSDVSGVGGVAAPTAGTAAGNGFREGLERVLAATHAVGEPLPGAAEPSILPAAVVSAIPSGGAPERPVGVLAGPAAQSTGNNLPEGGKLLPPAAGLLQNLTAADSPLRLSGQPVEAAGPDSGRAAATAAALSRATAPTHAPGELPAALRPDRAVPIDLLSQHRAAGAVPVGGQAGAEPGGAQAELARSLAVASALSGVGESARRLHSQRTAQPDTRADAAAVNRAEVDTSKFIDTLAARLTPPPTAAATDNQILHAGLQGRAAEYLSFSTPANVSSENVLRDLQSMLPLRPQVGEAGQSWSAGLGQRLLMMADNGVEVARLRLTPAHLGPLEIHVNIDDSRAQVWFGAQHAQTREALETALPRLREMFADQGLELTQADVEDHSHAQNADAHGQDSEDDQAWSVPAGAMTLELSAAGSGRPALLGLPGDSAGVLDIYV